MNDQPTPPQEAPKQPEPVAYDSNGRPLYAAPPTTNPPQPVYMSRAVEPQKPAISPEVQKKHDESVRYFPSLNLSEAEYIISAVKRHPIGLVFPVAITTFLVAIVASFVINYSLIMDYFGIIDPPPANAIGLVGGLLILLFLLGGYIAVWVYNRNTFYLTNESVIQEIQTSLMARNEQTVSLINIEDASFEQRGFLPTLLNYGSIRLSTEGDETTYRFSYVTNPKQQIALLNNAVEAFKNGRPVVND